MEDGFWVGFCYGVVGGLFIMFMIMMSIGENKDLIIYNENKTYYVDHIGYTTEYKVTIHKYVREKI